MRARLVAFLAAIVMGMGTITVSAPANAQCWNCEPQGDMYICIGMGLGNGTLFNCGPTWANEPPFGCKTDEAESCGTYGCPGCFRYPALVGKKRPKPLVSTQLLIFRLAPDSKMDQVKRFAVGESGLLASSAVDALNALGADVGELVGASVETGVVGTMTQHLAGDGSGVAVHSTSTPDGFNLAVFSVTPNGSEAILRSWFERRGEALVLPATIDGGACVVVVSSQRLEPAETDGIVELNHEAFTEAATAYPRKNLALLRTDRPGAASHQLRLAIAHAMTSGMLAATRTAH